MKIEMATHEIIFNKCLFLLFVTDIKNYEFQETATNITFSSFSPVINLSIGTCSLFEISGILSE